MIDTVVAFVKQHGPALVSRVSADGGLTRPEAERFVPAASTAVVHALRGDTSGPTPSDVESLRGRLDAGSLAAKAGVEESKIGPALEAFLPALLELGGPHLGALARLLGSERGESPLSGAASLAKKFFQTP